MDIMLVSSCFPLFAMLLWTFWVCVCSGAWIGLRLGYILSSRRLGCKVCECPGAGEVYSGPGIQNRLCRGPQCSPAWLAGPLPSPPLPECCVSFPECWWTLQVLVSRTLTVPAMPFLLLFHLSYLEVQPQAPPPCLVAGLLWPLHAVLGVGEEITSLNPRIDSLLVSWF